MAEERRFELPGRAGESGPDRIGLGLAALGRPGYLNLGHGEDVGPDHSVTALRRLTHEVLDAAYEAGVRYFDAARSYGRAEEFLGQWLADRDPPDVVVGSKWGYVYTAGWEVDADPPEVKHHDVQTLRRQLHETRERLGDRLALYQIHSATPQSGVLTDDAVVAELAGLRRSGIAVGLSVSGEEQPETIGRAVRLGVFDAVQATWNLHERSAEDALALAHERGMAVLVKEALANGRLTARGDTGFDDATALAGVLARPWVDVVLSGAATVAHLRSNLRALEVEWTAELERDAAALVEDPGDYWDHRGSMAWT